MSDSKECTRSGEGSAGAGGAGAGSESPVQPHLGKVIIDTDPGVDDSMALLCALASERIEIVGLTLCMGNHHDMDVLARNASLVVGLAGKEGSIPVVKGQSKPLMRAYGGHSGMTIHGEQDCLGNLPCPFTIPSEPTDHDHTSAARFLVDTCAANPGEVTLVTLGPLTNIATACALDAKFSQNVKRIVMMGGTVNGTGNKAPAAEANIHNDPEAAKIVFNSFSNITMAGLNVTHQVPLSEEFRLRCRSEGGKVGEYMYAFTQHYIDVLVGWGNTEFSIHDGSAVMALLHPELFTSKRVFVDVETKGELTAGATVADWKNHWGKTPNTDVLMTVDAQKFHDTYIHYLSQYAAGGRLASFVDARFKAAAVADA